MDVAIAAVGAAAPSLRLRAEEVAGAWGGRARGALAVCAADEDVLTLGWLAATRALRAGAIDSTAVEGLWWATTTPPFADGPSSAYLAAALQLPASSTGALLTGSPHAGLDAIVTAADAVRAGRVTTALAIVSDAPVPGPGSALERRAGAGAVAYVLTAAGGHARLGELTTRSRPLLDRYRGASDAVLRDVYDPRLYRERIYLPEIGATVRAVDPAPTAWSLPDPDGRLARLMAKDLDLDIAPSADVYAAIGDAGAATTAIGAAAALREGGTVGFAAHGGGRSSALVIDADAAVPGAFDIPQQLAGGRSVTYTDALRARGLLEPSGEPIPMGVPPGGAGFVRGGEELLGLHGARCADCGVISTPPSVHPACVGCGGDDLGAVSLSRHGEVHTFVVNQTMPPPFVAPLPLVVIDLDDGARLMVQGAGDGSDLAIGDRVELEVRRYTIERGVPIYGYKAVKEA
ncbi:MAG: OB-fold domain-containing protein [Actinobacteria bacterium]|nr:OB-fold domain-containing protein [Actinomycetota bacterium]